MEDQLYKLGEMLDNDVVSDSASSSGGDDQDKPLPGNNFVSHLNNEWNMSASLGGNIITSSLFPTPPYICDIDTRNVAPRSYCPDVGYGLRSNLYYPNGCYPFTVPYNSYSPTSSSNTSSSIGKKTELKNKMRKRIEKFVTQAAIFASSTDNDIIADKEHQECLVCRSNKKQCFFVPCNHLCVCITCAAKLMSDTVEEHDMQNESVEVLEFRCILCKETSNNIKRMFDA